MKGVYTLILSIGHKKKIKVGKLGELSFPRGYYVYVGSGMRNLEKRVERYFKIRKRKWHIDFLIKSSRIERIILAKSYERVECRLSRLLEKYSLRLWKGFGSSDCKCFSHLHYFKHFEEANNALKECYGKLKLKSFVWNKG